MLWRCCCCCSDSGDTEERQSWSCSFFNQTHGTGGWALETRGAHLRLWTVPDEQGICAEDEHVILVLWHQDMHAVMQFVYEALYGPVECGENCGRRMGHRGQTQDRGEAVDGNSTSAITDEFTVAYTRRAHTWTCQQLFMILAAMAFE